MINACYEDAPIAHLEVDDLGIIVHVNNACLELFQSQEKMVGRSVVGLFSEGENGQAQVRRILEQRGGEAVEVAFRRRDGVERRAQVKAWRLRVGDRLQIVVFDVTKHHQQREVQVTEAREAIRARDEFLSVASHELRTPLAALVLQLATLQKLFRSDEASESNTRVLGKIDKAVKSTRRLTTLVDGLLDVSRIATGRLALQTEVCDLALVAEDIVGRTADAARRAGCELEVHVDGPLPGVWDRLRLEQILENLLSNAIKYGAGKPVELCIRKTPAMATITVRDHGMGIPAADLERIFGQFERAVPTRNYGGLGLGLYITRQIVEAHGGTIHAQSEPGAGALFVVELPRRLEFTDSASRVGEFTDNASRVGELSPGSSPGGDELSPGSSPGGDECTDSASRVAELSPGSSPGRAELPARPVAPGGPLAEGNPLRTTGGPPSQDRELQ